MGLAASQARLLFITARQSDVSAKMQRISNQNMILARDEDDVSERYNKMLNATKMQLKDDISDLSYSSLMGDAAINSIGAINIITNESGRVVLSVADQEKYGLAASGKPNELKMSFADFVGKADPANADAIVKALNGADGAEGSKGSGVELTAEDKENLKAFYQKYGEYPASKSIVSVSELLNTMTISSADIKGVGGNDKAANNMNGKSLLQIFNGQNGTTEIRIADDDNTGGVPSGEAAGNILAIGTAFMNKILDSMGLKGDSKAAQEMKKHVNKLANDIGNNWKTTTKNDQNANTQYAATWATSTWGDDSDHMNLNTQTVFKDLLRIALNNSANAGLTNNGALKDDYDVMIIKNSKSRTIGEYEDLLKKFCKSTLGNEAKFNEAKNYVSKSASGSETKTNSTSTIAQKANCYKKLYDALVSKGWTVENTNSIKEKLENGTYKVNGDLLKNNEDLYEEVADEETRAKAETFYDDEMRKIHRKEKQMDQDMTKLQTEYSSLTNDYNSVKGIIDANIQRSFTYCQQG